jgi:hypothetical protein
MAMKHCQEGRTLMAVIETMATEGPSMTTPSVAASVSSTDQNNNQQKTRVRRGQ